MLLLVLGPSGFVCGVSFERLGVGDAEGEVETWGGGQVSGRERGRAQVVGEGPVIHYNIMTP